MKSVMLKSSRGFTIVELLIVIVVIAILASITVVAYNGLQLRARNAQMASAIQVYKNALISYKTINGSYPSGNVNAGSCLGDDYPNDKCWLNNANESSVLMSKLAETLSGNTTSQLPMPPVNNTFLKGAYYTPSARTYPATVDGVARDFIVYSIEGNEPCPVGPVVSDDGNLYNLNFSSQAPENGQTVAAGSGNPVQCWMPLPE